MVSLISKPFLKKDGGLHSGGMAQDSTPVFATRRTIYTAGCPADRFCTWALFAGDEHARPHARTIDPVRVAVRERQPVLMHEGIGSFIYPLQSPRLVR